MYFLVMVYNFKKLMSQTDIYAFNILVFGFNLYNLVVCTLIFFLDFIQNKLIFKYTKYLSFSFNSL